MKTQTSAAGLHAVSSAPSRAADRWQWLRLSLAVLVIATTYLYRLDRPLLWLDEAQTGVVARNILHCGIPSAFDGRNAALCATGRTIDTELRFKQIPWLQFYVGAASAALFGSDTGGARVLFAVAGILAFFPLYAVLKPRLRQPAFMAALALLAPQTVMFQRNARYYPISILLYAVLLWLLSRDFQSRKRQCLAVSTVFVLLFHTQTVVALGCAVALLLFCLLTRRNALFVCLIPAGAGFLSWFLWYQLLAPTLGDSGLYLPLMKINFWRWLEGFFIALVAGVVDLDAVNLLPLPLCAGVGVFLVWRRREIVQKVFRDPVAQFILLTLLAQVAANAAVFGCETIYGYSLLRYICYAAVFAMVPCFMMLEGVIGNRFLFAAACLLAVSFNLSGLTFWAKPFHRDVPVSWAKPVYSEIFRPPENAWDMVVARLRREPSQTPDNNDVLAVVPDYCQDGVIYCLGDRYLVPPNFRAMGKERTQLFRKAIGDRAFGLLARRPEWILDFVGYFKDAPAGYAEAAVFPSYRARPDDGTRPELTRHAFPTAGVALDVRLFRLEGRAP